MVSGNDTVFFGQMKLILKTDLTKTLSFNSVSAIQRVRSSGPEWAEVTVQKHWDRK